MKCEGCGRRYSYKTVIRSILLNYRPLRCEDCGTKQVFPMRSRFLVAIIIVLPLPVIIATTASAAWLEMAFVYLLFVIPVTLVLPFAMR
ncbi:TIGR04104 family putative zinc finger protein [Paenibacillus daejeonensis]|uniref:TIGR04104 family putative zinc finger protein n=1 Tax=Paenibacillus daejeonensis TaxID=135193 RepID=UPI00037B89EA